MAIGGYFKLNYDRLLVAILLMAIGAYFINGYWWLLVAIGGHSINGHWWLNYHRPLVLIGGYR